MKAPLPDDRIDDEASRAFADHFGTRATQLPPLAIVIAAYNEEGSIGPVIDSLPRAVSGLDVAKIVVSDGSVDATVKEAGEAGALVCEVPVNRGQGAALRLGYRLAREGGAQYIVTTDADGQYNPAEIEGLLAPILAGRADFVTGSRTMGSEETRDPVRRLGVRVFAVTISALTGQKISDTTFGLRAMRAEVTGAVRLDQQQYQAAELLIGVMSRGYRVAELPGTIHRRKVGESKKGHNAVYGLHFGTVIARTWWRERVLGGSRRRGQPAAGEPRVLAAAESPSPGDSSSVSANPSAAECGVGSAPPATPPDEPRSAKRT